FPTIPASGNTALPSPTSASSIPTAILSTQVVKTPVVYATAAPVVKPAVYVLHQGEYPYCLARRFNVNPEELLTLNGLSSSQSEYTPGTSITIPSSGGTWPGTRALKNHPAQYIVETGDTIYSIACEFGDADPMAIASVNGLSGDYSLTAGTAIQIP
ncbi:MAG: LysM peptidoglycan-binding domain-containing protein, partial [Chloroflexota bacterium]